jgi:xanthine dehydrogenase large subunit
MVDFATGEYGCSPDEVVFTDGMVHAGSYAGTFAHFAKQAYLARVQLSAAGFYKTPKLDFDRDTGKGRPFYYFAYGAAVSEVEVDVLTGEYRVLRADLLHDAGASLNPAIDLGQVEGAFIQGMGWLTTEELFFDTEGRLKTHAPSTYKIPTIGDRPVEFNVELWSEGRNFEETIFRSKAVGEPPFMLAISVFSAMQMAIEQTSQGTKLDRLDAPLTPERVLLAINALRQQENPSGA